MAISSATTGSVGCVKLRDARVSDCAIIAELINESAEGAAEYLFANLQLSSTPIERLEKLLQQEVYYSYANSIIAEADNKVVGMALSFPSDGLTINSQIRAQYSEQQLRYVHTFVDNKIADCWHLDALCVLSEYRNLGIGSKLLAAVKDKAREYHYARIGVFVFGSNASAERFYRRHGFAVRAEIDTQAQEFLRSKNCLRLMEYKF